MTSPDERRFWEKVRRASDSECWEWTASKGQMGHGFFRWNGRVGRAHRFAWESVNGPIPDGLCVCHRCDNPPCVNPAHLFLGTRADNNDDRHRKGRTKQGAIVPSPGEKNGRAKLTAQQVETASEMKAQGVTLRAIGEHFGVDHSAIWQALKGRTWQRS